MSTIIVTLKAVAAAPRPESDKIICCTGAVLINHSWAGCLYEPLFADPVRPIATKRMLFVLIIMPVIAFLRYNCVSSTAKMGYREETGPWK